MSSLKPTEKKHLKELLGMNHGDVLGFSNSEFKEFVHDIANIDIYSETYACIGNSKSKRLRSFWIEENNEIVSNILEELLKYWRIINKEPTSEEETLFKTCSEIITNLGNSNHTNDEELQFLKKEIPLIDIKKINLDEGISDIIGQRLEELSKCMGSKAPLSVVFLCGSILEGILFNIANKNIEEFNRSKCAAKHSNGKNKKLNEWSLSNLIDSSHELNIIGLDIKKYSHVLRDFRNYIHPSLQLKNRFHPDMDTAKISFQVLKAAINDLHNFNKEIISLEA